MRSHLNLNDCSGAKVTGGFNSPSVAAAIGQVSPHIKRGTELPVDVLKTIPRSTLDAMVTNGRHLVLRPKPAGGRAADIFAEGGQGQPARLPESGALERVVIPADGGKFDVIEGVKINAKPLTNKAAQKLADAPAAAAKH